MSNCVVFPKPVSPHNSITLLPLMAFMISSPIPYIYSVLYRGLHESLTVIQFIIELTCVHSIYAQDKGSIHYNANNNDSKYAVRFQLMSRPSFRRTKDISYLIITCVVFPEPVSPHNSITPLPWIAVIISSLISYTGKVLRKSSRWDLERLAGTRAGLSLMWLLVCLGASLGSLARERE